MYGKDPLTWKTAAVPLAALTAMLASGIVYFVGDTARDRNSAAPSEIKFDSGPNYAPGADPMARSASQAGSSIEMFRKVNASYSAETAKPAPGNLKAARPKTKKDLEEFMRQMHHEIKYDSAAQAAGDLSSGSEETFTSAGGNSARAPRPGRHQEEAAAAAAAAGERSGVPKMRVSAQGVKTPAGGASPAFSSGFSGTSGAIHGGTAARRQHEADRAAGISAGAGGGHGYSASRSGGEDTGGGGTGLYSGSYGSHRSDSAAAASGGGTNQGGAAELKAPPAPVVYIWPRSIDFGSLYAHETAARQIIVMNIGDAPLAIGAIENINDEAPFYLESNKCSSATLAPGKSCTFNLRFSPRAASDYTTAFEVANNDAGAIYYQSYMEVKGNSKNSTWTSWWTSRWGGAGYGRGNTLDFGMVPEGYSMSELLRVTNTSGADWYAVKLDVSKLPASFRLSGDSCTGAALPSGQSCTLTVTFAPTDAVNRKFSSAYYGQYLAINPGTGEKLHHPRPKFPPLLLDSPVEANPNGEITVMAAYSEYDGRQEAVLNVPIAGRSCAPYPIPGLTRLQHYYYFR